MKNKSLNNNCPHNNYTKEVLNSRIENVENIKAKTKSRKEEKKW